MEWILVIALVLVAVVFTGLAVAAWLKAGESLAKGDFLGYWLLSEAGKGIWGLMVLILEAVASAAKSASEN